MVELYLDATFKRFSVNTTSKLMELSGRTYVACIVTIIPISTEQHNRKY